MMMMKKRERNESVRYKVGKCRLLYITDGTYQVLIFLQELRLLLLLLLLAILLWLDFLLTAGGTADHVLHIYRAWAIYRRRGRTCVFMVRAETPKSRVIR